MAIRVVYGGLTELLYDGLKKMYKPLQIDFIGYASTLYNLKIEIQKREPDLAIVSMLRDGWKVSALCKFRDTYYPEMKIIVLTMRNELEVYLSCITQGIDGWANMLWTRDEVYQIIIQAFPDKTFPGL